MWKKFFSKLINKNINWFVKRRNMRETVSLILLIIANIVISVVYIKGFFCETKRWMMDYKKRKKSR